jgi:hypothetical protein
MKIRSVSIVLSILVSIFATEMAFAGAWTTPKGKVWGEYYMKWDYATDGYDDKWNRSELANGGRNWGFTMAPRIDYGIADGINSITRLVYKQYNYKEYTRPSAWGTYVYKNHGLTSVDLGGKIRIIDKPCVVSIQEITMINPGYDYYYGSDNGPFYAIPDIGDGATCSEDLRIIVSKAWTAPLSDTYKLPMYASGETGYLFNNHGVCGGWVYFLEGGCWPRPWLLLKTELDGYKSNDGTGSRGEKAYGILRFGGAWQIFGDSTLRQGDKIFNLEFTYGMTIYGKNTTAYDEYVLKVQTQF